MWRKTKKRALSTVLYPDKTWRVFDQSSERAPGPIYIIMLPIFTRLKFRDFRDFFKESLGSAKINHTKFPTLLYNSFIKAIRCQKDWRKYRSCWFSKGRVTSSSWGFIWRNWQCPSALSVSRLCHVLCIARLCCKGTCELRFSVLFGNYRYGKLKSVEPILDLTVC